jgi:hypothetical protein
MTPSLEKCIQDFAFPKAAPTQLDDALAFLRANPLPPERYKLASKPAKSEVLAAAEAKLKRLIPAELRTFLQMHNGIEETWVGSGPILASAGRLFAQEKDFREEWASTMRGAKDEGMDLTGLFAIGYLSGRLHFLLDTTRVSETGDFPVSKFDAESASLRPAFLSLGHYIAWIVCDAHTHPQEMPPKAMLKLFPMRYGQTRRGR